MASFLTAFLALESDYAGRDHDTTEVLKYLHRTTRLNYRLEDLEDVCEFLGHFPKESGLTRNLVQRGLKAHPESALLHVVLAGVELSDPAAVWRLPDVRGHLEKALRLAEASTRRREILMIPKIKQMLSVSNELHSRMAGLPFAALGGMPVPGGKQGSSRIFSGHSWGPLLMMAAMRTMSERTGAVRARSSAASLLLSAGPTKDHRANRDLAHKQEVGSVS